MPDAQRPTPGLPVQSYCGPDSSASFSKQRHGHRILMKLSLVLTATCALLFFVVCVPHLHSHFYLISGSLGSADGVQRSTSDLAGLSDRIVPYKIRIGYFTYTKPLTDDRVIAVFPPRFVPGSDIRDQFASMRGLTPGIREEYIDDVSPVVLRIAPKLPTGGMVSLIGLRFGNAGSVCDCNFGGLAALSCEVKSPELAIIELPPAARFQMFREANAQPSFIELKLNADKHLGVSRIYFGSAADTETRPPLAQQHAASHAAASQVLFEFEIYRTSRALAPIIIAFTRPSRLEVGNPRLRLLFAAARRRHPDQEQQQTKNPQCRRTKKLPTFPAKISRESLHKPESRVLHDEVQAGRCIMG
jgi:hypothetical protein